MHDNDIQVRWRELMKEKTAPLINEELIKANLALHGKIIALENKVEAMHNILKQYADSTNWSEHFVCALTRQPANNL